MAAQRPFANLSELLKAADKVWASLGLKDWLQAFCHHPPIGEKRAKAKQSSTARHWSAREQAATQAAPELLATLATENKAYSDKFGFTYLICATGKSTEEILKAVRQRMLNNPETELRVAAEEQRKITRLRLEKLLSS